MKSIQNLTVNTNVTRSSFVWFRYVVFNATFNILFGEEAGVSDENHLATVSHWQTLSHNVVSSTSRLSGFEFTKLVVISTDYIGSRYSNYHTIVTTTTL
jgi:hypothetical protein